MRSYQYTLLLLFVVAGSSWAAFGMPGGALAFLLIVAIACYIRFTALLSTWLQWTLHIVLFVILVGLMLPAVSSALQAARRAQCTNNLKQIVLALLKYDEEHGHLPPPCVYDEMNRPMHSWRVLILPYLDCKDLYEQYDLNEPWDGPNNKRLLVKCPSFYKCPSDFAARETPFMTSYVAIVGEKAIWKRDKDVSLNNGGLKDARPNSIVVTETASSGISWTEPRDFRLDDVECSDPKSAGVINPPHMRDNGYFYRETPLGANAAFADGDVHFVSANVLNRHLLAMGGATEENARSSVDDDEPLQLIWPHVIGLPIWLISVILLLHWAVRRRKAVRARAADNVG